MKKLIIILCVFWISFIFYNSSNIGQVSHDRSIKIVEAARHEKRNLEGQSGSSEVSSVAQLSSLNKWDHIIRKNAHAFEYFVLSILLGIAAFLYNIRGKDAVIYVLFACLIIAVSDEFYQCFVPGRASLVSDVIIDFCGSVIGIVVLNLVLLYNKLYINCKK